MSMEFYFRRFEMKSRVAHAYHILDVTVRTDPSLEGAIESQDNHIPVAFILHKTCNAVLLEPLDAFAIHHRV